MSSSQDSRVHNSGQSAATALRRAVPIGSWRSCTSEEDESKNRARTERSTSANAARERNPPTRKRTQRTTRIQRTTALARSARDQPVGVKPGLVESGALLDLREIELDGRGTP